MFVVDKNIFLVLIGMGDVFEFEGGVMGIGLGGNYVLVVVCVLVDLDYDVEIIVCKVMVVVVEICVYINDSLIIEILDVVV